MSKEIPEFVTLERAALIVAPFAHQLVRRQPTGFGEVLAMIGQFGIGIEADCLPPLFPLAIEAAPLTKEWFASTQAYREGDFDPGVLGSWNRTFFDWAEQSLKVRRQDMLDNLAYPFGVGHQAVEDTEAVGCMWSFPQALAWIATADTREVARIQYGCHWGKKPDDASAALVHNERMRRRLVGWLQVCTSIHHCRCNSRATAEREAWAVCQCVGAAYDRLRIHVESKFPTIPEYSPQPSKGTFTIDWFDGAEAIRIPRLDVVTEWPAREAIEHESCGFAPAQKRCEEWLEKAFGNDPLEKTKPEFRTEAMQKIPGLSGKAFDRAWGNVAPENRTKPGAKRKS